MREEFDGQFRGESQMSSAVEADRTTIGQTSLITVSDPPTNFVDHSGDDAQVRYVDEASRAKPIAKPGSQEFCDDQKRRAHHGWPVVADSEVDHLIGVDPARRIDQQFSAAHNADVDPVLIATIQEQWRRRRAWHRAEKSLTLQAKALCRRLAVDGDKKEADVIYAAALGKGEHAHAETALAAMLPLVEARDGLEKRRKDVEKRLAKLATQLPVAAFVIATRGVGIASLAAIVGEAGDLSAYANPGKLWKRMGLAVMPDGRQRRVAGEAAIAHGYNAERRSVMWNIGACIVKAGGPLKQIYDERKAYELPRVETKGHAHNRAQRYVEKRFLRLLWQEWKRQAKYPLSSNDLVPAAQIKEAA